MEPIYPPLPDGFRPELLRRLSLKETLMLVNQFGVLQICERLGYQEFTDMIRKVNADVSRLA